MGENCVQASVMVWSKRGAKPLSGFNTVTNNSAFIIKTEMEAATAARFGGSLTLLNNVFTIQAGNVLY